MDSHYASPDRGSPEALAAEIALVSANPLVSGLLHSVNGVLAVLDERRQVVAANDNLLKLIGIEDPAGVLGLRPGEAVRCVHAHETAAGCGTTQWCSTCGAAIAIVSSLSDKQPAERLCALTVERDGRRRDLALMVRAQPLELENNTFLLLFLQDVSLRERRAALERTFYHDINNMLAGLVWSSEQLAMENDSELTRGLHQAAIRLVNEIAIQRALSLRGDVHYQPATHTMTTRQALEDCRRFFEAHPAARRKRIEYRQVSGAVSFVTDRSLLSRILANMIINALEATEENGEIRVYASSDQRRVSFSVWNAAFIPEETGRRIFQRNFSTKGESGRGIGTFSMKFFGESILGGTVDFRSSEAEGTTFVLTLPRTKAVPEEGPCA